MSGVLADRDRQVASLLTAGESLFAEPGHASACHRRPAEQRPDAGDAACAPH
ncbi:hypothetical protein [Nocardioides convexus]|uniref:hypothetical protein n=1 Tax=Nocardioides convexus TaxID=2712224 RepID=UPI002418B281|nr:hypothetical protein [Nocardioides convexus]